MGFDRIVILTASIIIVNANVVTNSSDTDKISDGSDAIDNSADAFKGVYTECFLYLSYSCLQKKTLMYLKALNNLSEVAVIGDYLKFVKINISEIDQNTIEEPDIRGNSEALSLDIDNAVNKFFDSHILRFKALGKDIPMSHTVDEFVGRKKRKGGGGGGGGGHDHDDGKKKMMMMAMMCMKMKMMMMIPAMMGMMGMMSFKGMMFSMMSFMISKMMLLMKILEKKGGSGGGGGGGGGGDGWAAAGGGGGAWMPAGGQDGGGGGYDANGQWQSRSIIENNEETKENPMISYVTPLVRYNNNANGKKPYSLIKNLNDEIIKTNVKSRKKRGIMDVLQNAYVYWMNQVLGARYKNKLNYPKYKIINGVKYVYYPLRYIQKAKKPKSLNDVKQEELKTVITAEDFNKGEIVEGPVESRMHKKKLMKMKDSVTETVDDNPWE